MTFLDAKRERKSLCVRLAWTQNRSKTCKAAVRHGRNTVASKSHEADFLIRLLKWPRISHAASNPLSVLKIKDLHGFAQMHLKCCKHAWSVKGNSSVTLIKLKNSPGGRRWDEDPTKEGALFSVVITVDLSDTIKTLSSCTKPCSPFYSLTTRVRPGYMCCRLFCNARWKKYYSKSGNVYTVSELSCRHTACRRVKKSSLFFVFKKKKKWKGCEGLKSLVDTVKDLFLRHCRSLLGSKSFLFLKDNPSKKTAKTVSISEDKWGRKEKRSWCF